MRAQCQTDRKLARRSLFTALPLGALLLAVTGATYFAMTSRAVAAPPGAPVITSFVLTELSPGNWQLSGTVTASEGLEGMVLYFGGLVDEEEAPEPDGSFSIDVVVEPQTGDWADVYAIDRWELQSDTVTRYF